MANQKTVTIYSNARSNHIRNGAVPYYPIFGRLMIWMTQTIILHCWFTGTNLALNRFPKWNHRLISEQTAIGWRHLFNGHLSKEWHVKEDYCVCHQKSNTLTHTGACWLLCTLTVLWMDFFLLWTACNEAIHGHDQHSQHQSQLHKL